eukprot:sb/3476177/
MVTLVRIFLILPLLLLNPVSCNDLAEAIVKFATLLTGKCPPINGVDDRRACWLRLSQLTFPGSHNSGAIESELKLGFLNLPSPDCRSANQELSIQQQLDIDARPNNRYQWGKSYDSYLS